LEAKGIDPSQYAQQKKTLDALTEIEAVAQKAADTKGVNPEQIATGLQMAIGAMMLMLSVASMVMSCAPSCQAPVQ
ncbi:MAG: hypothetical protein V4641_20625, partial [Pseudomonadota bacterium]